MSEAIPHLIDAACLREYYVYLAFDDGTQGVLDLKDKACRDGIFAPLNDTAYFRRMRLDETLGTICWPNGADLSPDMLYRRVREAPIRPL